MTELITELSADYTRIEKLAKISKNELFEININIFQVSPEIYKSLLSYPEYYKLMKYLIVISKMNKLEIVNKNILDIEYSINDNSKQIVYTLSLTNNSSINHYINILKDMSNINIFAAILKEYKNGKKNIEFYKKVFNSSNDLKAKDFDMTFRKYTKENVVNSDFTNLNNSKFDANKIIFKLRNKLILHDANINIQLSKINESVAGLHFDSSINSQSKFKPIDDYYTIKIYSYSSDQLKKICEYTEKILKVIQSSNFIISNTMKDSVLNQYKELLHPPSNSKSLEAPKVLAIEIKDLTILYDKYSITDKADGEHAFIIIMNKQVYIITQNLDVINTGIILKSKDYDNTIFDGERIFIKKENRYIFMVFDCLYYKNQSLLDEPLLINRLKKAEEIIKDCFVFKNQNYSGNNYDHKKSNISDILKFYSKELLDYFKSLNHDIKEEKKLILIRPKYFMFPIGIEENEIFQYSKLFWRYYKSSKDYPYNLDGLVYQPINQKYYTQNYRNLKWKPEENNSIDFYIEYERDPQTHKILTVFNNLIDESLNEDSTNNTYNNGLQPTSHINDTLYRICKLYVGQILPNNKEIPVKFDPKLNNPNHNVHIVNLIVDPKTGNCLDSEGNVIQDHTVVEFYYHNDEKVDEKFRWIPMRTRFDKTEQVTKYQQKYGNNKNGANHIWFSINYPITFDDIEILADSSQYNIHKNKMLKSIGNINTDNNVYYSKQNKELRQLSTPQRDFHGLVKTIILATYCKPEFNNNRKINVIDIGVGQGGDILKYFQSEVKSLVGLEPNYNNIYAPGSGAIATYNRYKKQYPGFFQVNIINSDFTLPLTYEAQETHIQDKTPENKNRFNKYLSGKFKYDVISCIYSFHYFPQNEEAWNNTCNNINKLLAINGYLIITCFDAHRVEKVLKDNNGEFTQYLDISGNRVMYHSIQKLFDDYKKVYGPGNKINVYNGLFMNQYIPEYLVDDNFIIPELNKKCGLQLIETDYYENMFNNMRDYITSIKEVEQKPDMKSFLEKVFKFYEQNDLNAEFKKITFLNRYYVFQKVR